MLIINVLKQMKSGEIKTAKAHNPKATGSSPVPATRGFEVKASNPFVSYPTHRRKRLAGRQNHHS